MISLWVMLILRNDDDNRAAIQDSTIMRLLVFNEHGEFLSSSWPRPEPWKIVAARDFLARKPASAIEELVVGRPPDPSQRKDWSLPIIYRPGQQAVMGGIFVMAVIDTRHFVQHFERMQPVSYVKIDRSFINNIRNDINDATIVSSTISLCHNLNLQSIAEGVETREQLAHLRAAGCDQAQGYLFSRPLPPEEIPALLQECIYQDQTQGEKNAPSSGAL